MKQKIHNIIRKILISVLPNSYCARYLAYIPKLREWKNEHKEKHGIFKNRYELYDFINTEVLENRPIDYIEFGVFKGRSIKYWSKINQNIKSQFYGFDTFEGLPEKWTRFLYSIGEKHFNTKGVPPTTDDKRVSFIKGMFQKTLTSFLIKNRIKNRLVINMDADLYTSTLYVLTKLDEIIVPGTIIFFDEFSSVLSEFRALEDYTSAYLREYRLLGATKASNDYYTHIAIEFL